MLLAQKNHLVPYREVSLHSLNAPDKLECYQSLDRLAQVQMNQFAPVYLLAPANLLLQEQTSSPQIVLSAGQDLHGGMQIRLRVVYLSLSFAQARLPKLDR